MGGGGGGGSGSVIWDNVLDVAKGGGQYSLIQAAINGASGANQAVWVMPGNYTENLWADHPDVLIRGSMALSRRSGPNTGARISGTDDAGPLLSVQEDTTVVSINFKKTLAAGSGLYTGIMADDTDYALKLSESRVVIDDGALGRNVTCVKVTGNVTDTVRSIISRCVIEPTSTATAKAVDLAGGVVLIEYSDIEGDIVSAAATDLYLEFSSVDGDVTGTGAGDLYLMGSYVSGIISGWNSVTYRGSLTDHTHSAAGDGGALAVGTTDTDATAGRVFFAGASGVLQEDANLTWNTPLFKVAGAGEIEAATTTNVGLILQTTDDNTTKPLLEIQASGGGMLSEIQAVGNLNFATATAANPGIIEVNDGRFLHTYGTRNLFAGIGAGNFTLTGTDNLSLGQDTLPALTTGSYNLALGYNALKANTTGVVNLAIGRLSLTANVDGNYNVGVGDQALEANTSGSSNVAVGYQALEGGTTGSFNLAVGRGSLKAINTGSNNLALGYLALTANTSGGDNAAVGTSALGANTIGNSNAAVGTNALRSNTEGGFNVGIGSAALFTNTTGEYNVAIGYQPMYLHESGDYNVGIGASTLRSSTTATFNTAIGQSALYSTQSGGYNVGIGGLALRDATNSFNVSVGHHSLRYQTTPQYNVGIGTYAGRYNVTGGSNVYIGYAAGQGASANSNSNGVIIGFQAGYALTTGGNNVLLGYRAGNVLTTGASNIIIGYDVDPSGAAVSNELNIGDLLKGYLSAHASGPAIHFMGGTPQAQQAHIVDADGTLADVTTKFNTLLADLEGYGLLAAA
jgi:hypothetical protein